MSIDRNQVPYMPNLQPQVTRMAERVEYRRLLMMALALVAAALAGWLYLRQASIVAAYWHEIGDLEARKSELRQNIGSLQTQAAEAVSLAKLQASATELGFRQPVTGENREKVELTISLPAEAQAASEAPAPGAAAAGGNLLQRIWQRFQAWLRAEPGT